MRALMLLAASFCAALAGCDDPEVSACEVYLGKTLKDPSTFRRLGVSQVDQRFASWEAYQARTGDDRPISVAQSFGRKPAGSPGLRLVDIQYQASNGFGETVSGSQVCAFQLRDGRLRKDAGELERDAIISYSLNVMRGSAPTGAEAGPGPKRKFDCCL